MEEEMFHRFTFLVEKGKVKEFVQAIGDSNTIYVDEEEARKQGFRNIPVPPTFGTVIEMWAGLDFEDLISKFNLNILRVLHGEQSYEYKGQLCVGDEITGETTVIDRYEKKKMTFLKLKTTYTNQFGDEVLVAKSLIIER
ncbi:MaoC family dehydratase N-terminal domain-containing protein [Anaerobacillus sp. MEB173]|uniref:MaoC family dehydratase N-terminal domain-containing protein n=1 Tax=Anaerobacillus sp. MEB173 TaxID=3383345 RepID=UPI003F8FB117